MKKNTGRSKKVPRGPKHFPHRSIEDRDLNTDEQHQITNTKKDVVQESGDKKKKDIR